MSFSFIYAACPDSLKKSKWAQLLYEASSGYLWVTDIRIKLGALFLLYMLYQTQPKPNKYKIQMSVATWREIFKILDEGSADALAVVAKLRELHAFCLYAQVSVIPPPSSMPQASSGDDLLIKFGAKGSKLNLETIGETAYNPVAIRSADAKYRATLGNATSIISKTLVQDMEKLKEGAKLRIEQAEPAPASSSNSMDISYEP